MRPMTLRPLVLIALMILAAAGCDEDKRVVKVATDAADRQAEQNRQIAKQNHEISGTTKALVEADAQARKELITIQKDLQAQQAEVGRQRDQMEVERREIATERQREPVVAQAITGAAVLLACLLPLVLAWQILRTASQETGDPVLTEVLIEELASGQPLLAPPLDDGQPVISLDPPPQHSLAGPLEAGPEESGTAPTDPV